MQVTGSKTYFNKHGTTLQEFSINQVSSSNGIWKGIQNALANVGNWFKNMFQQAWNNIVAIFNKLGQFFSGIWNNVTSALSGIGNWFKNMFQQAWNNITGIFNGIGQFFQRSMEQCNQYFQ